MKHFKCKSMAGLNQEGVGEAESSKVESALPNAYYNNIAILYCDCIVFLRTYLQDFKPCMSIWGVCTHLKALATYFWVVILS